MDAPDRREAMKLHRCSTKWKFGPCWRVQKALDRQGIDYVLVKGPARPSKRAGLQRLSGQTLYPVIEFENGSIYREECRGFAPMVSVAGVARSSAKSARAKQAANEAMEQIVWQGSANSSMWPLMLLMTLVPLGRCVG